MRMRIGGLQKVTLLDYPGKVACTVFLPGCNLRCPFCHNPALAGSRPCTRTFRRCCGRSGGWALP